MDRDIDRSSDEADADGAVPSSDLTPDEGDEVARYMMTPPKGVRCTGAEEEGVQTRGPILERKGAWAPTGSSRSRYQPFA